MKYEMAESILRDIMEGWDMNRKNEELRDIQIISEIKYDDYQQYTHGMRYVESLALWLRQFETYEEKELAYKFIKDKLIYISEEEMRQLVEFTYPMKIKQYLLNKTRNLCEANGIDAKDERKLLYNYLRRASLFLGLSDGAHIDYFRRQNPHLSNEQIYVHYDFSDAKAKDMLEELEKDIEVDKYNFFDEKNFNTYFLLDDFSASGKSYIRKKQDEWKGKIYKFFDRLEKLKFKVDNIDIHLILYLSTENALEYIRTEANEYFGDKKVNFSVDAIQKIEPLDMDIEQEFEKLFSKNYEDLLSHQNSFVDRHFDVGGGKYPYRGFADCSLPLVIYHNTPNNSFPILWYGWDDFVNALFPRVSRHKEI